MPDPTVLQAGAVGVLFFVLVWFMRRAEASYADDKSERGRLTQENAAKEAQLDALRAELAEQRALKHAAINRVSSAEGTLSLVRRSAKACTCGVMKPLMPLLEPKDPP